MNLIYARCVPAKSPIEGSVRRQFLAFLPALMFAIPCVQGQPAPPPAPPLVPPQEFPQARSAMTAFDVPDTPGIEWTYHKSANGQDPESR